MHTGFSDRQLRMRAHLIYNSFVESEFRRASKGKIFRPITSIRSRGKIFTPSGIERKSHLTWSEAHPRTESVTYNQLPRQDDYNDPRNTINTTSTKHD